MQFEHAPVEEALSPPVEIGEGSAKKGKRKLLSEGPVPLEELTLEEAQRIAEETDEWMRKGGPPPWSEEEEEAFRKKQFDNYPFRPNERCMLPIPALYLKAIQRTLKEEMAKATLVQQDVMVEHALTEYLATLRADRA